MTDLVKRLREGTTGTDITKTDVYLNKIMNEAAEELEKLLWARDQENSPLEEVAAHKLMEQRQEIERLSKLLCEVAQETRDLGLLEGETNAKVQEYAKSIKEGKSD